MLYVYLQIAYDQFNFQMYKDKIDLLEELEDLHVHPPRFALECTRQSSDANLTMNITVKIKYSQSNTEDSLVGDFCFHIGAG